MRPHAATSRRDQVGEGGPHFTSSSASSQADVDSWSDVTRRERTTLLQPQVVKSKTRLRKAVVMEWSLSLKLALYSIYFENMIRITYKVLKKKKVYVSEAQSG